MNHKYRKLPVVIEAFQMTKETRQDNKDWPEWLNLAWNKEWNELGAVSPKNFPHSDGTDPLMIMTLEGFMEVEWDAYIVQGIEGELYACRGDIFEKTYEKVND